MPDPINPNETDRVRRYTPEQILRQIDEQIEHNVAYYGVQSDAVIERRIEELKREWSINRYLQANVAALGFMGAAMGLTVSKKWILLTVGAFGFFLGQSLTGWDPMVMPLRRIGLRTRSEIDREIFALKIARGDFKNSAERGQTKSIPIKDIVHAING